MGFNRSRYGESNWDRDRFWVHINPRGKEVLRSADIKTGIREADRIVLQFLKYVSEMRILEFDVEIHDWAWQLPVYPFPPHLYSAVDAILHVLELPPMQE